MDYWDKKLLRKQISQKLEPLKEFHLHTSAAGSWVKIIREALGMSMVILGRKMGVSQPRISAIEKSEVDGNIKISTLQEVAKALNMTFVYGFVPEKDLETLVREQSKKIAKQRMKRLDQTMSLEDQEIGESEKEETLSDLTEQILVEEPSNFWDL